MMNARRLLGGAPVAALLIALAAAPAPAATTPAITAFDQAFSKVGDYTVTVQAYEALGSQTQHRTYHYWFKRPNLAKTLIVSGDGSGSGGVWNGGDSVSGHQGGLLSFIHLKVGIHDPRATSLRGATIPDGLLQNEVDKYRTIAGSLSQRAGPVVNGTTTDEIDLKVADPSSQGGVTRMVLYLNKETHWPVRQVRFAGSTIVADVSFSDLKTNVGLTDGDFPY